MTNYYKEFNLDLKQDGKELCNTLFTEKKSWNRKQNSPNLEKRQEAERMVVLIDEAMDIFSNENKRKEYDEALMQTLVQENAERETQQAANQQAYYQNNTNPAPYQPAPSYGLGDWLAKFKHDTRMTSIVAYLYWCGWIVAFFAGDREGAKVHLNSALVIYLLAVGFGIIGLLGSIFATLANIANFVLGVFWLIGLIGAIRGEQKELPFIGTIHIL